MAKIREKRITFASFHKLVRCDGATEEDTRSLPFTKLSLDERGLVIAVYGDKEILVPWSNLKQIDMQG